jgi:hypothetical protein
MKARRPRSPLSLPGPDPAIQSGAAARAALDHRVKPGDDKKGVSEVRCFSRSWRMSTHPSWPRNPLKSHDILLCMGSFRRFRRRAPDRKDVAPGPFPWPRSADFPTRRPGRRRKRRSGAHGSLRTGQWVPDQRFGAVRDDEKGRGTAHCSMGSFRRIRPLPPFHGLVPPENAKRGGHHRGTETQRNQEGSKTRRNTNKGLVARSAREKHSFVPSSCLRAFVVQVPFSSVPLCLCGSLSPCCFSRRGRGPPC